MSHEKAVKRIIRYLKKTKDEGLILNVDKTKGIECFVDADLQEDITRTSQRTQEAVYPEQDMLSSMRVVLLFGHPSCSP